MDEFATYLAGIQARRDAMTKPELRKWIAELERERRDQSWKKPRTAPVQVIRIVDKKPDPAKQAQRDQIMFHAGRYAAGAKDKPAVNAQKRLQKLLESDK